MGQDILDKLLAKRDAVNARIQEVKGRERSRERRRDTRRKVIAGALVLSEEDSAIKAWLYRTLGKSLLRKDERDLFGLPPLPAEPPTIVSDNSAPSAGHGGRTAPAPGATEGQGPYASH